MRYLTHFVLFSFISTATANGKKVGIYTNWYDWSQITGSTAAVSNSYSLWYWQVNVKTYRFILNDFFVNFKYIVYFSVRAIKKFFRFLFRKVT